MDTPDYSKGMRPMSKEEAAAFIEYASQSAERYADQYMLISFKQFAEGYQPIIELVSHEQSREIARYLKKV